MDKKLAALRLQKGTKPKLSHPTGLIALGSRPNTPENLKKSSSTASLTGPSKRGDLSGIASKKSRLDTSAPTQSALYPSRKEPTNDQLWTGLAISAAELGPKELLARIKSAEAKLKTSKVSKYLCAAVKLLLDHRTKPPDPLLLVALAYVARNNQAYLQESATVEALCALLKHWPNPPGVKHKVNTDIAIFGTKLLETCYADVQLWPSTFVKVYLDDSLSDRVWVDRSECHVFVLNILTSLGTRMPGPELKCVLQISEATTTKSDVTMSPYMGNDDEASRDSIHEPMEQGEDDKAQVRMRFSPSVRTECVDWCLSILREWWSRRLDSVPKQLVKTMSHCSGISDVRLAAAQKIDAWIQNPKLHGSALELLLHVFVNSDDPDLTLLAALSKLRTLKTKSVLAVFSAGLKDLVHRKPENLSSLMKLVLHNELSTTRAPHNMVILQQCFIIKPTDAAKCLSSLCIDLLKSREDYLKSVRIFLREFIKSVLRWDFPMVAFGKGLFKAAKNANLAQNDDNSKRRLLNSTIDLLCLTAFLGISPAVKDAFQTRRDVTVLRRFYSEWNEVLRASIRWLDSESIKQFKATGEEYVRCFYRLLFLEKPEVYSAVDNWPLDADRNVYLSLMSSSPLPEDVIARVLSAALSPERPIGSVDAIDFTEQTVRRAAGVIAHDEPLLAFSKSEIVEQLLQCCVYRPPSKIPLPQDYELPLLAVISHYWKAWSILLILSAHNPSLIGSMLWNQYPTMRTLMHMTMTGEYTFPPVCSGTDDLTTEMIIAEDEAAVEKERKVILELENHLAPTAITESTSHLLPLLCDLNARGPARKPPTDVLEKLRELNDEVKAGMMLCRSRQPDFLLEIINQQGAARSMPWLISLIESNEGSLSVLPIQCLCEFLLHQIPKDEVVAKPDRPPPAVGKRKAAADAKLERVEDIKNRLRSALWEPSSDLDSMRHAVVYLVNALQSATAAERAVAVRVLCMLVCDNDTTDVTSCLSQLPSLPHFSSLSSAICTSLATCCMTETDPGRLMSYIQFVYAHMNNWDDAVLSALSQLIVDRTTVFGAVMQRDEGAVIDALIHMFAKYLQQQMDSTQEQIAWSARPDLVLIEWPNGTRVSLAVRFVSASVLLLCQNKPLSSQDAKDALQFLTHCWFPASDTDKPNAFLVDTSEEAELTPEWLRLEMMRSGKQVLVDCGLTGLEPTQILCFTCSFGLPVASVQRLLEELDRHSSVNPDSLKTLLDNAETSFSKRLPYIKAQQARGVTSGKVFVEWAEQSGLAQQVPKPSSEEPRVILKMKPPKPPQPETMVLPTDQAVDAELLPIVFSEDKLTPEQSSRWSKLLATLVKEREEPKLGSAVLQWLRADADGRQLRVAQQPKRLQTIIACLQMTKDEDLKSLLTIYCYKLNAEFKGSLPACVVQLCAKISANTRVVTSNSVQSFFSVQPKEIPMDQSVDSKTEISSILESLSISDSQPPSKLLERYLLLDPEIVDLCPEKQVPAIFGATQMAGQRYLLSLIPHQSRMDTLQGLLDTLLVHADQSLNPTSVLDFVWACIHLPRVWIGRDRTTKRSEDILGLSSDQLSVIVDYMLAETAASETLHKRLELLLACCGANDSKEGHLVQQLVKRLPNANVQLLLLELYFERPKLITKLNEHKALIEWLRADIKPDIHSTHTKLDVLVHRLMTDLFEQAGKSTSDKRIETLSLALRALAASHPSLMLRHLPLLDAELRGTTSMTMRQYSNTNHKLLFTHLLKLLQALRPTLYHPHYNGPLQDVMNGFLDLVKNHGIRNYRAFLHYVDETLDLLLGYYESNPSSAGGYLESCSSIMQALSLRYPDLPRLQSLLNRVTALQLPMETQSAESLAAMAGVDELRPIKNAVPPPPTTINQMLPMIRRLHSHQSNGELRDILSELDQSSYNKPDMLMYVLMYIEQGLFVDDAESREFAWLLMERHLNEKPKHTNTFYTAVRAALQHKHLEVVRTAFKHLAELVVVFGDESASLLDCAHRTISKRALGEEACKQLKVALDAAASVQM